MRIKKKELINILEYAYRMSRVISPYEAEKVGLHRFDGAVCEFYKELIDEIENGKNINLNEKFSNEFLSLQYECMTIDIEELEIYKKWNNPAHNNEELDRWTPWTDSRILLNTLIKKNKILKNI